MLGERKTARMEVKDSDNKQRAFDTSLGIAATSPQQSRKPCIDEANRSTASWVKSTNNKITSDKANAGSIVSSSDIPRPAHRAISLAHPPAPLQGVSPPLCGVLRPKTPFSRMTSAPACCRANGRVHVPHRQARRNLRNRFHPSCHH